MRQGERLRTQARRLWRWLFPEEVELPEEARRTLAVLYPSLDLRRVSFHRGLPHFLRGIAEGITLPGAFSARRCRIYIRHRSWSPRSADGLGLLAHEAFHALQMQEAGPGLGLVRPFIVLYLACAAGNRFLYRGHPMEDDAYHVAGRHHSLFESACVSGCGIEEIAVPSSGLSFWRRLAASAPGARRVFGEKGGPMALAVLLTPWVLIWLLAWTGATAILWLAWLLTVSLGVFAAGAVWLSGALLWWIERIFPAPSN